MENLQNYIKDNILFYNAFKYAPIGKAIVGLDGRWLAVNQSLCHILGYSEEELLNLTFQDITYPDDLEIDMDYVDKAIDGKLDFYSKEKRYFHKKGWLLWANLSVSVFKQEGKPVFLISQIEDISNKKKLEMKLRKSGQQYRNIIEASPDPMFILDREGTLVFANKAAKKLLSSRTHTSIIGSSIFDILLPEYWDVPNQVRAKFHDNLEVGTLRAKFNLNKTIIDVQLTPSSIIFDGKEATLFSFRDISQEKMKEETYRELLMNSEKLTAVGQLAAGIAHEIRNPLTTLRGFVQLLPSTEVYYQDIMLSEIDRINGIVSEMLFLAKPQTQQDIKTKEIQKILKSIITLYEGQQHFNHVTILAKIEPKPIFIHCFEDKLKQVFMNVIKNAFEAMPNGGQLTIELLMASDSLVSIRFSDQGEGIPKEQLDKLGDPFFTTKSNGTGLGLMICYQVIQDHNGSIHIQSEQGVGTTVEIRLPFKHVIGEIPQE